MVDVLVTPLLSEINLFWEKTHLIYFMYHPLNKTSWAAVV